MYYTATKHDAFLKKLWLCVWYNSVSLVFTQSSLYIVENSRFGLSHSPSKSNCHYSVFACKNMEWQKKLFIKFTFLGSTQQLKRRADNDSEWFSLQNFTIPYLFQGHLQLGFENMQAPPIYDVIMNTKKWLL